MLDTYVRYAVLQAHYKNVWKSLTDPTRCDFHIENRNDPAPLGDDADPVPEDVIPLAGDAVPPAVVPLEGPPPLITIASTYGLHELARRQPQNELTERTIRRLYTIQTYVNSAERFRNLIPVQHA